MRDGNGPEWDKRQGGWLHPAEAMPIKRAPARTPAPATSPVEPADRATRDAVYRALLAACPLSDKHRAWLTGPGNRLPADELGLYGSMPSASERGPIIAALVQRFDFDVLRSVPGLVENGGRLRLGGAGKGSSLLQGIMDLDGLVAAVVARLDDPEAEGARYRPLTSHVEDNPDGLSPGTPAHIVRPAVVRDAQTLLITEGSRKAHITALQTGLVTIGCFGVASWRAALPALEQLLKQGVTTVVIAFDADDPAKPDTVEKVERHRLALAAELAARGFAVRLARWDHAQGKGIDDLLLAGHSYTVEVYRPGRAVPAGEPLWAAEPDGDGVSVPSAVLAYLLARVAAAHTVRLRYQRVRAILADPVMSDGQKLTAIALSARLPVPHANGATTQPVTVYAETIARDLGSKVTRQKNGTLRPTKQNTVTKHLADIASLGVVEREAVKEPKVVTVLSDKGQRVQKNALVTTFRYRAPLTPLPGDRMNKEEAGEVATRAKADRERRRCPRCYSECLRPTHYTCEACGHTATAAETVAAGEAVMDCEDGTCIHCTTGEKIIPGVPVAVFDPAATDDTDGRNPGEPAEEEDPNVVTPRYRNPVFPPDADNITGSEYRITGTIARETSEYRITVLPAADASSASMVVERFDGGDAHPSADAPASPPRTAPSRPARACHSCGGVNWWLLAGLRPVWRCTTCHPDPRTAPLSSPRAGPAYAGAAR